MYPNVKSNPSRSKSVWRGISNSSPTSNPSAMLRRSLSRKTYKISFFTDVEGDGHYFNRFVNHSEALFRSPQHVEMGQGRLELADGYRFVFGGDLFDKGFHDQRLCLELTSLKQRFPDRVTLIIGNRDAQKLKTLAQLDEAWCGPSRDPAHIPLPFYFPDSSRTHGKSYQAFLAERGITTSSPAHHLRYLLPYTFGAPDGVVLQKRELAECKLFHASGGAANWNDLSARLEEEAAKAGVSVAQKVDNEISDDELLQMYRCVVDTSKAEYPAYLAPFRGALLNYLRQAQVMAIHDDALFVHGAVNDRVVGYVPSSNLEERYYPDTEPVPGRFMVEEGQPVEAWANALNSFMQEQLSEWAKSPRFDPAQLADYVAHPRLNGDFPHRGGAAFFAYGYARSTQSRSAIVSTYFSQRLRPMLGSKSEKGYDDFGYTGGKAVSYLNANGIGALFHGHQPIGDIPKVVSQPGLRLCLGDISYCAGDGTRGGAVSEVVYDPSTGGIRLRGVRVCGSQYDFTVEEGSRTIGRKLVGGWWVRAPVSADSYLLRRSQDRFFSIESQIAHETKLRELVEEAKEGELAFSLQGDLGDAHVGLTKGDLRPPHNHEKEKPDLKTKRNSKL